MAKGTPALRDPLRTKTTKHTHPSLQVTFVFFAKPYLQHFVLKRRRNLKGFLHDSLKFIEII